MASVLRRAFGRLKSLPYQMVQLIPQRLGKAQIHAQARTHVGFGDVACINNSLRDRQVDYPINQPPLGEQTWENGGNSLIYDSPFVSAYLKRLAASQNHPAIFHQKYPFASPRA